MRDSGTERWVGGRAFSEKPVGSDDGSDAEATLELQALVKEEES